MAGRISFQYVRWLACLLSGCTVSVLADTTLASYNFDHDVLDSGPDTYQIFRHRQAKADISDTYASSGYASAHLTDAAFDGNFVEFQGYFPEQQSGTVHFRFSFLIANPGSVFNVALAGSERYRLSPLGINFWLVYRDGWLRQISDGIPKKAFQPNPFEWYGVDTALNLDTGHYDLRIASESGMIIIDQPGQLLSPGQAARYSLKEFSFVGDLADRQGTDLYIDDVVISTSGKTTLPPLVAPGRRQFFVELWNNYHKETQGKLQCLPARNLEDFGIFIEELENLAEADQLDALYALTHFPHHGRPAAGWEHFPELAAIMHWHQACANLQNGKIRRARQLINLALASKPDGFIYLLTDLLIAAAEKTGFSRVYAQAYRLPQNDNDLRPAIALAMAAFHARHYAEAESSINDAAFDALEKLSEKDRLALRKLGIKPATDAYIKQLQRYMPENWETWLKWLIALEQQYYALLWQGNHTAAYGLAHELTTHLGKAGIAPGIWLERQGDAAFLSGDANTAREKYNELMHSSGASTAVMLKLADTSHILGDMNTEKKLREQIYRNFTGTR